MTLQDIKRHIETFELVPCGLKHELVKLDSNSKLPIKHTISGRRSIQRIELCPLSDRNKRLGLRAFGLECKFYRLIDQLELMILQ